MKDFFSSIKKASVFFSVILFSSCGGGGSVAGMSIGFDAPGYSADYVIDQEEQVDYSSWSKEELKEALEALCMCYQDSYVEWDRAQKEAERLWAHDQVSYRRQRKIAGRIEAELDLYLTEVASIEQELERRDGNS